jgi:isochorismate synthase/2-succinyl-5-enolpyruvyl-6-hydroxy-3-cyclohexene-1-carboxylate synthase/2-succinyl-6-hydroxy-2,4-cyclohexadiene-1-carboxylate synthase/O-succinylbenzoate synthase
VQLIDLLTLVCFPLQVTYGDWDDRPLVLFLHGFLGSKTDWLPVMKHLTPSARCIAVDLPGHGQTSILSKPKDPEYLDSLGTPRSAETSGEPAPSESGRLDMIETLKSTNTRSAALGRGESIGAYGMESVGDAVVGLIEQLRRGGQKVMVVGYSMGGRLALYLAVKHPELVSVHELLVKNLSHPL